MFRSEIKQKQPFASDFLEKALTPGKEKLANSYLLTGSNIMDMYFLAMETARILNCSDKTENCTCNNCGWVQQNRHPAVTTISPIDYIQANKDGKAKTVITVEQARQLRQQLQVSSRYHRVVIFTDAKEGKDCEHKTELLWQDYQGFISPPALENTDTDRKNWIPEPLTYKIFHSEPANSLLKILEEPPPGITFFFFARDKEDMLDTIVSRSQVIPLAFKPGKKYDFTPVQDLLNSFPPQNPEEALLFSEKILEISKENSVPLQDLLDMLEERLVMLMKESLSDKNLCFKIIKFTKNIHKAKIELQKYVNPQAVMDSLFISFSV